MKKLLFLLLIIACPVTAQSVDSLFVSANELYKNGKFEQALENYKAIESLEVKSSELYYNLGNSYYKINKVGPSIYYYEKALKLNPLDQDAKNNLVFAKRLALDNIEELPQTVFQKLNKNYLQQLSYNQWAVAVVIFSFLAAILFLLYYYSYSSSKKRLFFITCIICFFLLAITIFISYNQYNYSKNNKEAIIFAEKTDDTCYKKQSFFR